ncbi:hypothetical protein HG531_010170 [Fusarium graminearum]|nr:hypothetical protein HG531_010170 [Fusarium graminearum]
MGSLYHLVLVLSLGNLLALLLGGVEGVEVGSTVVIETLRVLVDDVGGDFVEERSVVRYDEDGTGVCLKVIGQESNGWDVQHVGRFVKKKQVRLTEQGSRKSQTHSPTTREGLGSMLLSLC